MPLTYSDLSLIGILAIDKIMREENFEEGVIIKISTSDFSSIPSFTFVIDRKESYENVFEKAIGKTSCFFDGFSIISDGIELEIKNNSSEAFFDFINFINSNFSGDLLIRGKPVITYGTLLSFVKEFLIWSIKKDFVAPVSDYIPQILQAAMNDSWQINPSACITPVMYSNAMEYANLLDELFSKGV